MEVSSLLQALHEKNPYAGFDSTGFKLDLQGWNSERPVFRELIEKVKPSLIIEVGVWKGASAIHMAKALRQLNPNARLLAVDTWLGSWDFWDRDQKPGLYQSLRLKHGFPQLYSQFLFNVLHSGMQEVIVPFPQNSLGACRWLKQKGVQADLIYIDGGHDEEDAAADLRNYFEILRDGGVIFGDDYADLSCGVSQAVRKFAQEKNLCVELKEEKQFWIIEKNKETV